MKRHRNATIVSSDHDAWALARYIESFAETSPDWEFLAEKSAKYERMCGEPSCCIVTASHMLPRAALHFTIPRRGAQSLIVPNIVPLVASQLSIDEYNEILAAFAKAFRARVRRDAAAISVRLSKSDLKLADLVAGRILRKLFNRYLTLHPLSHHPADIRRLDEFTCALSRHMKKRLDLDAFQVLLMDELGWSPENALWCRSRVEIGLDVLAANRSL